MNKIFLTRSKILRGFTLIELLVAIALIGILSTLVMANLNSARERSRDIQRKSDLKGIATALELYYDSYGNYPSDLSSLSEGGFINTIPSDPLGGKDRESYGYTQTGNGYTLTACLENKSDAKCGQVSCAENDSGCLYSVMSQ